MAQLEFRLLGGFQAHLSSGRLVELATRKARALLAYLALHAGRAQSREKLIALLWSDRAERQGRDSLRQGLTALRRGLGAEGVALLAVTGDAIAIEASAVEVDALTFEQLLARGRPEALERAVDLYRGYLLDGIGVRDPAFEDWLYVERERLHGRAVEALANLLTHQAESACPERAMATAARLLQLDPLQEVAHRTLMRLHAARGQRGLALRQYQVCSEVLKRQLGVAPEPETVALYDAVRQGRELADVSRLGVVRRVEQEDVDDLPRISPGLREATPMAPDAPPAVVPPAERRHLTIVFVDLVGSMELSAQLDPEQMQELLAEYQNAVAGEAARLQGQVANAMGDGILVSFGWPNAHEDDAERAVWASLAIKASVGALRTPQGIPLAVRIGIASGLVVVGKGAGHGAAVVGETPNLASRLRALASPGEIIIAESTRRLLGDVFKLLDLGMKTVQGIRAPVQAFAVTGARPVASRFDARSGPAPLPMVGRDQELALLLERWTLAKAGEGQGVLLVGEAGIGKSRIGRALLDAVANEPHTRIRYQCSPHHVESALWPVTEQLTRAAGITADQSTAVKLDRLEAFLAQWKAVPDAAPLIARLLGLDGADRYGSVDLTPQAERARTLDLLVGQMLGLAAQRPLLVVPEDVHWIDPTTLELVQHCLDRIATAPVLMLLTSRPDRLPALAAHPHITRLSLNRLGRAGVEVMIAGLGGDRLPTETIGAIVARTDGVPLFVEELTKAVLESGETSIPASLHDSLMARLDHIHEAKEVAQIAACIGREFDYRLLESVAARPGVELASALDRLAAAELVFRRGTWPDATYSFKHALVRDTAYGSLLQPHRRELHGRIADALQRDPEAPAEILAMHLEGAGRSAAAVRRWIEAAAASVARSANLEAIRSCDRALALLREMQELSAAVSLELEVRVLRGVALQASQGYASPEVADNYHRARQLCAAAGSRAEFFPVLRGLHVYYLLAGQLREAHRLADELTAIAEREGERSQLLEARFALGQTLAYHTNEVRRGRDMLLEAARLYDPNVHSGHAYRYGQDPGVFSLILSALPSMVLGEIAQAKRDIAAGVALARRVGHPLSLAAAYVVAAQVHLFLRDRDKARAWAEWALAVANDQVLPFFAGWAEIVLGVASLPPDRERIDRGAAMYPATGTRFSASGTLTTAAESALSTGDVARARQFLEEPLQNARSEDREAYLAAETLRVHALTAAAEGNLSVAEVAIHEAWNAAEATGACYWAMRIATSAIEQGLTEPPWPHRLESRVNAIAADSALPDLVRARTALAGADF